MFSENLHAFFTTEQNKILDRAEDIYHEDTAAGGVLLEPPVMLTFGGALEIFLNILKKCDSAHHMAKLYLPCSMCDCEAELTETKT